MEKIILPEGFEIDLDKSSNTEIVLKKIEEKKFYQYADIAAFDPNCNLTTQIKATPALYDKIHSISQLHVLAEYYNRVHANGWVPDFNDRKQEKIHGRWNLFRDEFELISLVSVNTSEPAWASREIIELAYKHNKEIFEKALKL
jgi:hypothetical protein